ncbi:probable glutamate receptor isoform X2 [Cryptotermes secundus]|uniref:probable glutamate receptor isoform X2 n=1 Tax=Cryptotermes secundus TaxID=105785 RepID=UPI001454B850|nr:probable glutamate receptor isoform X2 [Cryptotermes secundus]
MSEYRSTSVNILSYPTNTEDWFRVQELIRLLKLVSTQYVSAGSPDVVMKLLKNHNLNPLYVIHTNFATREIVKQFSETGNMPSGRWLLFLESMTSLKEFFADVYIPLDCEFLVAQRSGWTGEEPEVSLTEVYNLHSSRQVQTNLIAKWSSKDGLKWSETSFFERRGDLHGISLKSAMIHDPPFIYFPKQTGLDPPHVSGYAIQFWNLLQERLNFTLEKLFLENGSHGSRNSDGTWSGIVGMVASGRADVGLNVMTITKSRLDVVHYVQPIATSRVTVYVRKPNATFSPARQILTPFALKLWRVIGLTVLLIAVLLSAVSYNSKETANYRIYNSIFYTINIFCQQSSFLPRTWPCRLICLTAYVTFMVLLMAYSASSISYLTVQRYQLPFRDFQGLLDDGTYGLGVVYDNAHEELLKNSKNLIIRKAYKTLVEPKRQKLPRSTVEGLRRLCNEDKYSFFCSKIMAKGLMQNLPCSVVEISEMSYRITVSMVISKQSPYKRFFNSLLLDFKSTGIIHKFDQEFWPRLLEDRTNEYLTAVTFEMVKMSYSILGAGICISVLVLCFERLFQKRRIRITAEPIPPL